MRRARNITLAVLALILVLVLVLFYFQNQDTRVVLFLDLVVLMPMQLSQPLPVPLLMLASFGAGLVAMGVFTLFEIFRREGRNRRARRDMSQMADRMRDDRGFDDYDSDF